MNLMITTGNKGGETKSFTAVSIADFCIRRGDNVILSDSERDCIQATATAIGLNSGMKPFSSDKPAYPALAAWKLGKTSTGWSDCMDDLSIIGFNAPVTIVADSGASQLQAMIDNLPVLGAAVEAGLHAVVVFLAGRTEDSTVAALALLKALSALPEHQRPQLRILLVDQDGADKCDFAIAKPFKKKGEESASSLLERAVADDPQHVQYQHIGRWPDILFTSTMIGRRLPSVTLKDRNLGFGTRAKLQAVMKSVDDLFAEIVPAETPVSVGEEAGEDSSDDDAG